MSERYNTPEEGTLDWHQPLNGNFTRLDTDVEIRDTESNRGSYEPKDGRKFLATDTGRTFIADGTEWRAATFSVPRLSSDPENTAEGQLWLNTTEGAFRVGTQKGTVDIASVGTTDDSTSDDTNNTGSTSSSDDEFYSGKTIKVSNYSGFQNALDALSQYDTLEIDTDVDVTSTSKLRTKNTRVIGAGGTVTATDRLGDMLRPEADNITIDGVTFDGGWGGVGSNKLASRGIGGVNLGDVSNLRIKNNRVKNIGGNAGIEVYHKHGYVSSDIYIYNNTVDHVQYHGILVATRSESGRNEVSDVIIESNTVTRDLNGQAFGCFAQKGGTTKQIAYIDNLFDNRGYSDADGVDATTYAFEEDVDYAVAYGNRAYGLPGGINAGLNTSKGGQQCISANNYIENHGRAQICWDRSYDLSDGPPRDMLYIENEIVNSNHGFWYSALDGDLHVSDNLFTNCNSELTETSAQGSNTGSNYTFYNNGPNASGSGIGLPGSIGSSASWTDRNGDVVGKASWTRGSISPDDPVTVSVSTTI
jgi:hypothetical protein